MIDEQKLLAALQDIPNHHRTIVDYGGSDESLSTSSLIWVLSVVEEDGFPLSSVVRLEETRLYEHGNITENVMLPQDAWQKIGELKGWFEKEVSANVQSTIVSQQNDEGA